MNQSGTDSGQSMEDILASIRRIIAEGEQDAKGGPGTAPAAAEAAKPLPKSEVPKIDAAKAEALKVEVFELTQIVQDDGSIVNVGDVAPTPEPAKAETAAKTEPAPAPVPAAPKPAPQAPAEAVIAAPAPPEQPAPPLAVAAQPEPPPVDAKVETAMAALSRLMDLTRPPEPDALAEEPPERSGSALTVEELVRDAVRPLLRQWLDTNLPPLVERLVREAVDKLAKRAG